MKNIIVTADDYGVIPSLNKGIIAAVKAKKVNSVAVFANYKDSVKNTLQLLKATKGKVEIGCHLTITSGKPVTGKRASSLCKRGYFRDYSEFKRKVDHARLKSELNAQIKVLQDAKIELYHLTCHHNSLTLFPELFSIYMDVARKHGLPIRSANIMPHRDHSTYLKILRLMLLDDLSRKDRKELKTFGEEVNAYFVKNANGLKAPDILDSRHYGPIPLVRISKRNVSKKVAKKHRELDEMIRDYRASSTYDSLELMLHIAQDNIPRFNKYKNIDYPGINRRYFDSRIVEFRSIMTYDFKKAGVKLSSWKSL